MRAGMVGLAALYWPVAIGNGLRANPSVQFLAAATLGAGEEQLRGSLGMSASEYGARYDLRLYDDPEEMIEREGLDTVVLVTRHSEHADWVERLAARRVSIFIPKTFATTLADADRIVAAARLHGVRVAVGPSPRFLPPMMAAKRALDEGLIGAPFAMRLCHHHGTIDVFKPQDWYWDPQEGGPELSLGWYGVDLMLHFMGGPVARVAAEYGNFTSPSSPFMDCGRITLRMAGGAIASFDMYFCNRVPYPSWQLEVLGPHGVVTIHRVQGEAQRTVVSVDTAEGYRVLPLPERTPGWETFWIEEFLQDRPPAIGPEEARQITAISLAAREAARAGQTRAL